MIICFILSLVTLVFTVIAVADFVKRKKNLDSIVFAVAISCFAQMLILTIGLASLSGLDASSILQAIGSSVKAMGGEANTSFIDEFKIGDNLFNQIYCVWLYAIWFISPIAAGGVLISTLNRINSLFNKKTIKKKILYIFTELTPETLITAQTKFDGLNDKKEKKDIQFIFLSGNKELLKNKQLPAILSSSTLQELKINTLKVKNTQIWDFCFDGIIRTSEIIAFTENYLTENCTNHLTLNIFNTDAVSEKRYKSLIHRVSDKTNIDVFLSDTYKSSVHSILRNYPLYDYVNEEREDMCILVVGMGKFGYQFIGNVFGSCHFLNKNGNPVKLKITAVDIRADVLRDRALMESPDFITTLQNEGSLDIVSCNAENAEMISMLDNLDKIDYCVVATNNDEANIRITKSLKRYFIRKIIHENKMPDSNEELFDLIPPLVVKIRDGKKSEFVFSGNDDVRLIPFGSIETVYNYKTLSTNDIDSIAKKLFAINCNSGEDDLTKSFAELSKKFDAFANKYASKYDIDSTNEEAICLRYLINGCTHPDKKAMLSHIADPSFTFTPTDDNYYFRDENQKELEALVCLLHERWRYYTLYSGFSCPSEEDYKIYERYNKKLGLSSCHKFAPAFYNNLLKPADKLQKKSPCDYIKIKLMTYITKS